MDSTVNTIGGALESYWHKAIEFIPLLIGAIVVLIIGFIVAAIISSIVKKLLGLAENNTHIASFMQKWNIKLKASEFVGAFVWWVVFLVFLSAAVQILDVEVLTYTINSIVAYTPTLFAAAVIFALTLVGARVVKGLIVSALDGVGFKLSGLIGIIAYVAIVSFGFTLGAAQLGIETAIITANLTVIVSGIALAAALAFGLGSRHVAGSLIAGMVSKDLVKEGDQLSVDGVSGRVVKTTRTGIVMETPTGNQIVSYCRLLR